MFHRLVLNEVDRNGRDMGRCLEAIDNFCQICNFKWLWLTNGQDSSFSATDTVLFHVCKGPGCLCGGCRSKAILTLRASCRKIFMRLSLVPSLTRWTSVHPALAYPAVWLFMCFIGFYAIQDSFDEPQAAPLVAINIVFIFEIPPMTIRGILIMIFKSIGMCVRLFAGRGPYPSH